MRAAPAFLLTLVVWSGLAICASADLIELKNGGKLYGEITNAGDRAAPNHAIATVGGGSLSIPRDEVLRIVPLNEAQEEYHRRSLTVENTADAH